ncbi:GDSL esterase/lipase [Glycine soja]|nr:GDSL esterase/lipase [Glycine soja]
MKSQYLITLCFVLTLPFPLSSTTNSYESSCHKKKFPALYVFGDSLIDCGNNNHLPSGGADYLPYGIDFMGGNTPTGRATTNGKTVADFLAMHLGLPFVHPYLDLTNHQRNKIRTGINYASGGSGILPDTNNVTSLTLDKQIKFFHRTVKHNLHKMFNEKEKMEKHLSESLFFVSTGVNDYFHNGTFRGNKNLSLFLLNEFTLRIQRIYDLGARKFFVNNIPPAGCFPSKAIRERPRGNCDEKINKAISFYNRRLPEVLHELQSLLPGFSFVHADLFGFFKELRETGKSYGIVETWKPCCPNTIYGDLQCHPNTVPCPNRDTHLFWDEHPTQIVNQIYARLCFIEGTICKSSDLKLI